MYTTDCNYFNITNYNNVQEGYYRWTGCTGIVSVSPINTLDVTLQWGSANAGNSIYSDIFVLNKIY